ncbi:MAG: zinc ribbon domain-containing protein [Chitinivibrionales bacterium]|nr:zinc ribbon domain-containing protein [Chitinivibrionales bacterium]
MPTYEYECEKCGHIFEEFQSISANPLTNCPKDECSGKVRRLLSAGAGFLFKGSGFYITDYRSDSYQKAAKAESGGGSAGSEAGSPGAAPKDSAPAKAGQTGSSGSGASSGDTKKS